MVTGSGRKCGGQQGRYGVDEPRLTWELKRQKWTKVGETVNDPTGQDKREKLLCGAWR